MYYSDYILSSSAMKTVRLAEEIALEYKHTSNGAAHLVMGSNG